VLGRYEEALADLDKVLQIEPENLWGLTKHSEIYRNLKRYEESLADLNHVLELNPDYDWAIAYRAFTFFYMDHFDQSEKDLSHAIEMTSGAAYTLRNRAHFYLHLDRLADAQVDLDKAAELEPDAPSLHYHLARLALLKDEPQTALESAGRALDRSDPLLLAHIPQALAHLMVGNQEEAVTAVQAFLAANKEYPDLEDAIDLLERFQALRPQVTGIDALLEPLRAALKK
jgi:tetratricopeptide (TPR) repeat protein